MEITSKETTTLMTKSEALGNYERKSDTFGTDHVYLKKAQSMNVKKKDKICKNEIN